jgi:hypothetical protein
LSIEQTKMTSIGDDNSADIYCASTTTMAIRTWCRILLLGSLLGLSSALRDMYCGDKNCYATLGLTQAATKVESKSRVNGWIPTIPFSNSTSPLTLLPPLQREIKDSYRALARQLHPDRNNVK